MQDPKYDFQKGRIYHLEGGYFLPADEPVVVIRAKDPDSLAALRAYIVEAGAVPDSPEAAMHAESMRERLAAFQAFQAAHPERVRRGCHQCP